MPTYLPYFLPGSPEKQQINLVWPKLIIIILWPINTGSLCVSVVHECGASSATCLSKGLSSIIMTINYTYTHMHFLAISELLLFGSSTNCNMNHANYIAAD